MEEVKGEEAVLEESTEEEGKSEGAKGEEEEEVVEVEIRGLLGILRLWNCTSFYTSSSRLLQLS